MSKILNIYTTFDCIIKSDEYERIIKKEEIATFSTNKDLFILSIYPLDVATFFDAVIDLKTPKIVCPNSSVKLVDYKDETFLIQIKSIGNVAPKPYSLNYKKINFGGATHEIIYASNDTCLVCIKSASDKIVLTNEKNVGEMTFKALQNHLLFFAPTKENKYIFGQIDFVNKKYEKVLFQEVDQIETSQNQITTLKHLLDFGHHTIKKTFFTKNFSTKTQLTSAVTPQIATQKELIPYAFLDTIKVKNYDLAREYLSQDLKSKLDDLHLASFFGDFNDIFQNVKKDSSLNEIALFYGNEQLKEAKIFTFELNDTKITNIYED